MMQGHVLPEDVPLDQPPSSDARTRRKASVRERRSKSQPAQGQGPGETVMAGQGLQRQGISRKASAFTMNQQQGTSAGMRQGIKSPRKPSLEMPNSWGMPAGGNTSNT